MPLKQATEVLFDLLHEIFKRIKKATKYFIMFVGLFNFLRRQTNVDFWLCSVSLVKCNLISTKCSLLHISEHLCYTKTRPGSGPGFDFFEEK